MTPRGVYCAACGRLLAVPRRWWPGCGACAWWWQRFRPGGTDAR